jgi:anti-anti-sigma factor
MWYELNNEHLDIEPVYEDVLITFKEERIITQDQFDRISADIMKIAQQSTGKWVILEFKNVKFLSSMFLGLLVKLQTTVNQCRGHLKLRNVSPEIFKVFKITQLHKVFIFENAS